MKIDLTDLIEVEKHYYFNKNNIMKSTTKKWIVSCLVSFLTGFALVFLGDIDSITLDTIKDGSILGIVFSAVRAGIKAVIEFFLASQTK